MRSNSATLVSEVSTKRSTRWLEFSVRPIVAMMLLRGQRRFDVLGANVEHRHALWIEPDAHGGQATAAHPNFLHAGNRRQLRRHLPRR